VDASERGELFILQLFPGNPLPIFSERHSKYRKGSCVPGCVDNAHYFT